MAAVTGVMIVTTLLMVIDLLTRTVAVQATPVIEPSEHTDDPSEAQTALLARLQAEAENPLVTPAQLNALQAEAQRLQDRAAELEAERAELIVAKQHARAQAEKLITRRDTLAAKLADTRQRIAIASQHPPVTLLDGDAAGTPTWWVRLDGDGIQAAPLRTGGPVGTPETAKPPTRWANTAAFLADARTIDSASRAWVLLVTPSGVDAFSETQEALRRQGFDVGWDLAPLETPETHAETTP
ncbi:MAG: hypothetical protein AAF328_08170 [Planctomycetota bacterium]